MELVYLWVEDYKNIHKQGFNFSPRFSCEYDDVKNELTIKENNDYIENFFGENINVTAIVGKNGSGKSSVLEFIIEKVFFRKTIIWKKEKDGDLFYQSDILKVPPKYKNKDISESSFNYGNDKKSNILFLGFNRLYYSNIYDAPTQSIAIDMNYSNIDTIKNYFEIYHKEDSIKNTKIINFIKPEAIRIIKNDFYLKKLIDSFNGNSFGIKLNEKYREDKNSRTFNYFFSFERFFFLSLIVDIVKNKNNNDEYWDFIEVIYPEYKDNFFKKLKFSIEKIKLDIKDFNYQHQINKKYNRSFFSQSINNQCIETILAENKKYNFLYKNFQKIINFKDFYIGNSESKFCYTEKLKENGIYKLIFSKMYFDFFNFDFADNNKQRYYSKLSSGEKNMFSQFINLFKEIKEQGYDDYLILLDEPNNTFHPQWQKDYINELISFLTNNFPNKNFHIIITTHSPFLLSDIPKQNIIFLDTYEKEDKEVKNRKQKIGNCKVLTHDKVLEKKQTFGANIHTLLSDSFFMEGGLMGEFAKGKINEIKEFYEKVVKDNQKKESDFSLLKIEYEKNKTKFEQIQSIIGEPFLKTIVKHQLEEIESILFGSKAKEIAIERFIKEFGEEAISKVMNNDKN